MHFVPFKALLYLQFSSFSRYEAATIIKKMCLKELALGEILQILHMIINMKKWIMHHHSGWQPIKIALAETNSGPELVAAT